MVQSPLWLKNQKYKNQCIARSYDSISLIIKETKKKTM
jgi:hypothetical protein